MIVLMLNEDDGHAEIAFGVLDQCQIAPQLHAGLTKMIDFVSRRR